MLSKAVYAKYGRGVCGENLFTFSHPIFITADSSEPWVRVNQHLLY
jgi:hypothetical protein